MRNWKKFILLAALPAMGCSYYRAKSPQELSLPGTAGPNTPSFMQVKARVFQPYCMDCHKNFSDYPVVRAALSAIQQNVVFDRKMPKDRSMPEEDRKFLDAWIRAGAPESSGPLSGAAPGEADQIDPVFASLKKKIFETKCTLCHSLSGVASDVILSDWKQLVESKRKLVYPGRPDESGLMAAVLRTDESRMPPPSSGIPALNAKEIAAIKAWIVAGAPSESGEFPVPPGSSGGGGHTVGDLDPALLNYKSIRERVLEASCMKCHAVHDGSAPLSFATYSNVKEKLGRISVAVFWEQKMPPSSPLPEDAATLLAAWIKAGAPETSTPVDPLTPTYNSIKKNIIDKRCIECHVTGGQASQLPFEKYGDIVDSRGRVVIPKNADESGIVIFTGLPDGNPKRMPPSGPRLTSEEIANIRKWIEDGAKNETQ